MAISDDFSIDVVNRRVTYDTAFVDDRPPYIYTVNELYSWLQDTFDEPGYMQYSIPMSAQTPTQYTLINGWFIDDESMKALYGGSIQTSGWTYVASPAAGITQLRWEDASSDPPVWQNIGDTLTGGTSGATGNVVAVDGYRQVVWVRNTNGSQFTENENVTGSSVDIDTENNNGAMNGETIWVNLFSVGSKTVTTEIYVGQEDDYQGGRAFHDGALTSIDLLDRRIEKVDEWWDTDVDFATGSPNLLGGVDHFDILLKAQEAGRLVDSGKLFIGARQFGTVYSHFEVTAAAAGNFVVPFASTGADLNSAVGPYNATFTGRSGNDLEVGDVLENNAVPINRLRAVVTAVVDGDQATGNFDFYLIGENEASATYDRTLNQLANSEVLDVRDDNTTLTVNVVIEVVDGPAQAQGVTFTFANAQYDINEDSTDEEYALVINCNDVPLDEVYRHGMFLSSRGNQDGTTPDTQDTLLPTAAAVDEAGEFYRATGDITVPWNTKLGSAVQEGELVTNSTDGSTWTASGVVVAISNTAGASGQLTLTQVKGTWVTTDVVAVLGEHASQSVVMNGTPSSITDNTGAPFGTFAGGKWFVARGVVLINVPDADANNWETIDLLGNRIAPPTQRTITFAGLDVNDRAGLFEVLTAGEDDIRKNNNTWSSGGALDASTFVLAQAVALDVPITGWVRHVDTSEAATGDEYRYEYSDLGSGGTPTITLRTVSPGDDTCDAGGSTTVLADTNVGLAYGTDGNAKTGMMVRNTTTGDIATVLRRIDDNSIETTPVASGWNNTNGYSLNTVVIAMAATDAYYWPYIDDENVSGSSLSTAVKFVENTDLIARTRFSDPDVTGDRMLPFQQKSVTLEDANLTVTAVRTDDLIAT
jgi:hypothetical protein